MATTQPWNRCPFGEEDCLYPGDCGRYTDTNNDGICDLSQPKPVERADNQTQNNPGPISNTFFINANASEQQEVDVNSEQKKTINHYYLIEISLAIVFLYLGGKLLASNLKISPTRERKFWHVEFSIAMGLVGIFHALWHVKYYWKIFTGKK
ncbi:MAG: hypothetical protein PHD33_07810 [Atribacterota bacterium]|nr:hypothetical protein [Atribacterota bacterium]